MMSDDKQRAALMRVLAAAIAETDPQLRLYDCACWLLYAAARRDAANMVAEGEAPRNWSARMEVAETIEVETDDGGAPIWEDVAALARDLDPGYERPIKGQDMWGVP